MDICFPSEVFCCSNLTCCALDAFLGWYKHPEGYLRDSEESELLQSVIPPHPFSCPCQVLPSENAILSTAR